MPLFHWRMVLETWDPFADSNTFSQVLAICFCKGSILHYSQGGLKKLNICQHVYFYVFHFFPNACCYNKEDYKTGVNYRFSVSFLFANWRKALHVTLKIDVKFFPGKRFVPEGRQPLMSLYLGIKKHWFIGRILKNRPGFWDFERFWHHFIHGGDIWEIFF